MKSIAPQPPGGSRTGFGRGGPVIFALGEANATALEGRADLDVLGPMACYRVGIADPLEDEWLQQAGVLVLEVSADEPASLERIELVRRQHPELPVIAALAATSVSLSRTLLRQGVDDIASLPIDCPTLAMQLAELGDGEFEPRKARQAKLVMVAGSTGGCGATTVLTHLAAAMAGHGNETRDVCVIDLDLQAGEVAYYAGQEPRVTISTLLEAGDRLDAALMRGALTDSQHGYSIIAAPDAITALEDVDQDRLNELLRIARSMFDVVLLDSPNDWSNWSLSLALAADAVVLVTELSVAGLRQAKRRIDLFASIGVDRGRVRVIANRVGHSLFKPIGLKEAQSVLGCPIVLAISDEAERMVEAQNEGRLITDLHRHSRFASDIGRLAEILDGEGR